MTEIPVQTLDRGRGETSVIEPERVKSGAQLGMTATGVDDRFCILTLRIQILAIGLMIVDQNDVQDVHVYAIEHGIKSRITLGDVSMSVDRFESRQRAEISFSGVH